MPIYQYDCEDCQQRVEVFVRSANSKQEPACPQCGGGNLTRAVSQFARARSDSERVEAIDFDREMGRLRSGDVGDFARWARRMGRQYDTELGSEFSQMAERAEAGDDPVERIDPGHTLRYNIEKRRGEVAGGDGDSAG